MELVVNVLYVDIYQAGQGSSELQVEVNLVKVETCPVAGASKRGIAPPPAPPWELYDL